MLLVEEVEDGAFLRELLVAMEPELPAPKPKKTDGEKGVTGYGTMDHSAAGCKCKRKK